MKAYNLVINLVSSLYVNDVQLVNVHFFVLSLSVSHVLNQS